MEVVGEGGSTWVPKVYPRAMEVVEEGVTWASKGNPRQSAAAEIQVRATLVEKREGLFRPVQLDDGGGGPRTVNLLSLPRPG